MLDRLSGQTQARLLKVIGEIFARNGRPNLPSPNDDLSEAGLNSVDMVNLMLAVEAEFDLTIPQREITPENFRSAVTIEALIDRLAQATR